MKTAALLGLMVTAATVHAQGRSSINQAIMGRNALGVAVAAVFVAVLGPGVHLQ